MQAPSYSPLEGERIRLRPYRHADVAAIQQWVNTEFEALDGMGWWQKPQSEEETARYVEERMAAHPDAVYFVICLQDDPSEAYIGGCGLVNISWPDRRAETGIVISSPRNMDQGLGADAMVTMLRFGFDFLNLERVDLHYHEYNTRALACYKKCGFVEEGRLRRYRYWRGRHWDAIAMSILREEFYARWPGSQLPRGAQGAEGRPAGSK